MKAISVFAAALASLAAMTPASAETLAELAGHTHIHGIAVNRAGTAKLLIATHHGLYAVDDAGNAVLVSPVQDYMGFSPDPADPLSYYASGHPAEGGNLGLIATKDGGASWTQISPGLGGPVDYHAMDVSPADPKTIYGAYDGLQVSRDGGKTWTMAGALPEGLIDIAASALEPERIFAATRTGLFLSADAGASWAPLQFAGEPVSVIETGAGGALFAFVLGRGFVSANERAPAEWTVVSKDFGDAVPLHLAVDPKDGKTLYAATHTNAVLTSQDGGASWREFGTK
ncbi:MAG: F510_1955 family glycosylhydrolase [Hyphomicrobiales bacterium]